MHAVWLAVSLAAAGARTATFAEAATAATAPAEPAAHRILGSARLGQGDSEAKAATTAAPP